MKKAENRSRKSPARPGGISLPLPPDYRLGIIDRDATIISSWEIAYGCYLKAFERVISRRYPGRAPLGFRNYTLQYNHFRREEVYLNNYPLLKEADLKEIGSVSWNFYLENCGAKEFNRLIPGMDRLLHGLKEQGRKIAILTMSYEEGKWLKRHGIPVDAYYSVIKMRERGIVREGKEEAISHILEETKTSPRRAFTLGDSPKDHSPGVLSIGAGFGLGNPDARRLLESRVDIYAPDVESLFAVFDLPAPPSPRSRRDQKE